MRVLVITHSIDRHSGIGRYSYEVCKALERLGVVLTIVAEDFKEPVGEQIFLGNKGSYVSFLKNILKIRALSRNHDVVHAFDAWPFGIYGWLGVLGRKKKFFITSVGTYSIAPLLHKNLKRFLLMRSYRQADCVFSISNFVKNRIQTLSRNRFPIETVLLGLNTLPIGTSQDELFRKKWNMERQHPIFLTVGEIKDRKGQLDTLKGLALLKESYPDFLYCMLGSDRDTQYVSQIRHFAQDRELDTNIKIITNVTDDNELAFFYRNCDIFFLNSNNDDKHGHYEGFGLVCLEAAQFGRPCIGSRNCGIEDAIEDGYNGFLVEQRNTAQIYEKTKQALDRLEEISAHSIEFSHRFSWEHTARAFLEHYIRD